MSESSHLQIFRCKSRLLGLPVYLESKTGDYIVLWHDVRPLFPGARCIMNGDKVVPFLKDENFQTIKPERIKYQADVVLDVILETSKTSIIQAPAAMELSSAAPSTPIEDTTSTIQDGEMFDTNSDDISVAGGDVVLSDNQDSQAQGEILAITCTEPNHGTDIKFIETFMNERFSDLHAVLDENKALQGSIFEIQKRMHDMQKQTLDRLAIIQSQIQAVFTETLELHQYPVPRLFIILPHPTRRKDKVGLLLPKRFRLYFLCECGGHTNVSGTKSPHRIHLAKHEGYDLENSAEFFQIYGAYVQVMMKMLKYGYKKSGIIVPPLSSFEFNESGEKSTFPTLVDETISFLEENLGAVGSSGTSVKGQIELDQQEAFEGVDLRLLESFLRVQDKGRTLGNLYRTVTSEGHVKWICVDHYRTLHRGVSDQNLTEIVEINGGSYSPAEGLIHIKLMSKTLARQFYEVLAKAQRVQELYICLAWDASMKDLRDLREAVTAASIAILTIDGSHFKGPARDFLNSGRRFDPLVDLMSSGQIQSLDLQNFTAFYERIGMLSSVKTPLLRALRINTDIVFGSNTKKSEKSLLTSLLQSRQSLDKLSLHCVDIVRVFDFIVGAIPRHRTINTLRLRSASAGCTLMLDISEGAVRTVVATLRNGIQEPRLTALLCNGHLTQLTIKRLTSSQQDKDILIKVFKSNPSLKEIHCLCDGSDYQELIAVFIDIRKIVIQQDGSCSLRLLQLKKQKSGDLKVTKASKEERLEMTCNFTESKDGLEAHSNLHMGDLKYTACDTTTYHGHFRHYGWTVQVLTTNSIFSDNHALQFLNSLDGKKSKLTKLSLVTGSLSTEGLHCMSRIISASPALTDLDFHFDDLHIPERQDAATVILLRHGALMTGLSLNGKTALQWLEKLCATFPARSAWPKLKNLGLVRAHESSAEAATEVVHELSEGVAKWIAEMVTTHALSTSDAEAPSSSSKDFATVQPLRNIYLENIRLTPESWTSIIEAMDITSLETVSFKCSSIGSTQLEAVKDLLPDDITLTPP
ncbi:hypothetical protein BGZ68_007580 [Mortierella alpina]|nr:hypothetical protein BGZ68_007580 [Mortierella alpina]